MAALRRHEPFRDLGRFRREMDRLLEDVFGRFGREEREEITWAPADVREDPERLEVKVDLPGVDPKDVDIRVEEGQLIVRASRHIERKEERGEFHVVERESGTYTRSFTLPSSVDADKCEAKLENGVLTLNLPKKPGAKPKQIPVRTSS